MSGGSAYEVFVGVGGSVWGGGRVVGLNILHLYTMIRNGCMTLTMAGSEEQTWVTYGRGLVLKMGG